MKRSPIKRKGKQPAKPTKIVKRFEIKKPLTIRASVEAERCPYFFPEHFNHISQQCIREAGHKLPHHCGGLKK